jgi:hypothetical protein
VNAAEPEPDASTTDGSCERDLVWVDVPVVVLTTDPTTLATATLVRVLLAEIREIELAVLDGLLEAEPRVDPETETVDAAPVGVAAPTTSAIGVWLGSTSGDSNGDADGLDCRRRGSLLPLAITDSVMHCEL